MQCFRGCFVGHRLAPGVQSTSNVHGSVVVAAAVVLAAAVVVACLCGTVALINSLHATHAAAHRVEWVVWLSCQLNLVRRHAAVR